MFGEAATRDKGRSSHTTASSTVHCFLPKPAETRCGSAIVDWVEWCGLFRERRAKGKSPSSWVILTEFSMLQEARFYLLKFVFLPYG